MTLEAYQRSFHLRSKKKPVKCYSPDDYKKNKGPAMDEDEYQQSGEPVSEDADEAEEESMPRMKLPVIRENADQTHYRRLRRRNSRSPGDMRVSMLYNLTKCRSVKARYQSFRSPDSSLFPHAL